MDTEPIRAQKTPWGRKVATAEKGRICEQDDCGTHLSQYNKTGKCWVHRTLKAPRNRGKAV